MLVTWGDLYGEVEDVRGAVVQTPVPPHAYARDMTDCSCNCTATATVYVDCSLFPL